MSTLPSLGPRGEGWVAIQLVIFAVIAGAGLAMPGGWSGSGAVLGLTGGWMLIAAGGALALAGMAALRDGDALTAVPHPRAEASLVQHGAYRLVRHPVYGGLVVAAVGWAVARGSFAALAGAAVLLVFFDLKRRREEAWLEARFAGYAEYRARTRRLIPWIY
jgi:protein-S-isoprenylcysteine O-methyltransferase Ste14